ELPEIPDEYSDDEDEYDYSSSPASGSNGGSGRNKAASPRVPKWASSPAVRAALLKQSTMNPDLVFGKIKPIMVEEIFKKRDRRYRVRTSSANWVGTDKLTTREELEYEKRMGYR
ncbi:hypothetical protein BJ085DRAFT_10180, partial [Dimargaris cristalligena]